MTGGFFAGAFIALLGIAFIYAAVAVTGSGPLLMVGIPAVGVLVVLGSISVSRRLPAFRDVAIGAGVGGAVLVGTLVGVYWYAVTVGFD